VAFLKGPDARAEAACKFKMTHHQPERKYTWNNMVALPFCGHAPERGMHGDTEFQNRIMLVTTL